MKYEHKIKLNVPVKDKFAVSKERIEQERTRWLTYVNDLQKLNVAIEGLVIDAYKKLGGLTIVMLVLGILSQVAWLYVITLLSGCFVLAVDTYARYISKQNIKNIIYFRDAAKKLTDAQVAHAILVSKIDKEN